MYVGMCVFMCLSLCLFIFLCVFLFLCVVNMSVYSVCLWYVCVSVYVSVCVCAYVLGGVLKLPKRRSQSVFMKEPGYLRGHETLFICCIWLPLLD